MIKTYITYLIYYAVLKKDKKLNDHHPIIKKLIYLKSLIDKSKPIEEKIIPQLEMFLDDNEDQVDPDDDLDESDEESFEENAEILKNNDEKINGKFLGKKKKKMDNKLNIKAKSKNKNRVKDNEAKELIEDDFYNENMEKLNGTKEKLSKIIKNVILRYNCRKIRN